MVRAGVCGTAHQQMERFYHPEGLTAASKDAADWLARQGDESRLLGKSVVVRINDRGAVRGAGRSLDLFALAQAQRIGLHWKRASAEECR